MAKTWNVNNETLNIAARKTYGICSDGVDTAYIFGGKSSRHIRFNDLYKIKINGINAGKSVKLECIQLCNDNWESLDMPKKRAACVLNYYDGKLILFGGALQVTTNANDLWIFEIKHNKWKEIKYDNDDIRPSILAFHSMRKYGKYSILFGGCTGEWENDTYKYMNDLYLLDLETFKWKKIISNNLPSERCALGMCIVNGYLVIHGGWNGKRTISDTFMISVNDIINNDNPTWINIDLSDIFNPMQGRILLSYNNNLVYCRKGNELTIIYNIECLSMDKNTVSNIINSYIHIQERTYNIIIPNIIHPIIQQFYRITYKTYNDINEMHDMKEHDGCLLNINNISYIFILNCPDKSNAKAKVLILSQ